MGKKRKAFVDANKKGKGFCFLWINHNLLSFLGVRFDKFKGQHILKNPGVVHAIIEKVLKYITA